jgi:hypothetical protein
VPRTRIERIAREEKPVTADTALRLGKFFKTGAAFWMNIQARFDLETAEDALAPRIRKIASYKAACERCSQPTGVVWTLPPKFLDASWALRFCRERGRAGGAGYRGAGTGGTADVLFGGNDAPSRIKHKLVYHWNYYTI